MSIDKPDRFTTEQVLRILHSVRGTDTPEPGDVFSNTTLYDWDEWEVVVGPWATRKARANLNIGLFQNLAEVFGFEYAESEWRSLASDKTTIGQLAEFIAERAIVRRIEPSSVLGRPCHSAGVFTVLKDATERVVGHPVRIGPSSRIDETLNKAQRGRLTELLLPYYPKLYSARDLWRMSKLTDWAERCWMGCVVLTLLSMLVFLSGSLALIGAFCAVIALYLLPLAILLSITAGLVNWGKGPLRRQILTYRDLVNAIKDQPTLIDLAQAAT